MPNLPTHIHFALESLSQIQGFAVEDQTAAYILGSTAPDIRAITKKIRSIYHFVDLDFKGVGEGLRNLVNKHGDANKLTESNPEAISFMAGYASHLVLDETWITTVYRPNFGRDGRLSRFSSDSNLIWDRAFQLGLDKMFWETMKPYIAELKKYNYPNNISFLKEEPVEEWRSWILRLLDAEFNWNRLGFMANRIAKGDSSHPVIGMADDFLSNPDAGFEEILGKIPKDCIEEFSYAAKNNIAKLVSGFLS